jgi:hypothetical protein
MDNREIDKLIAEKVMGWCQDPFGNWINPNGEFCHADGMFIPTEDISAAWEVVEQLAQMGHDVKINRLIHWNTDYECLIGKDNWVDMDYKYVGSDTAPMAICLAALKAVGVEVEGEK